MKVTPQKYILSLCIPIFNRLSYLEKQLGRMLEDKDIFEEQIQLIISDNCSSDDLRSCCEKFQQQGLKLIYHRNETNIGPDGNFDWCFHHADGKYVWLLGSDDVPVKGMLREMIDVLNDSDYGLVHLSISRLSQKLRAYHKDETLLADINVWITFISANIIKTDSVRDYDLSSYIGSYMIQVPAYLNACLTADDNALVYFGQLFEKDSDASNNGGYNLFEVFVENLFGMYQQFIDKGMLSQKAFELIKEREYKTWLVGFVVDLLILKKVKRKNFDQTNAWGVLRKHYGGRRYFYSSTLLHLCKAVVMSIARPVYHLVKRRFS
mgnify:CR=1 FL=1